MARLLFEQRRIGNARHAHVVETLHQVVRPGDARFEPQHLELRKPFRHPVDQPVGHVDHVGVRHAERLHGTPAIDRRVRAFLPIGHAMEGEHHAAFLHGGKDADHSRGIDPLVARRRDHASGDAGLRSERLHHRQAFGRVVERKIERTLAGDDAPLEPSPPAERGSQWMDVVTILAWRPQVSRGLAASCHDGEQ
jgi:hypothetical protein